jgi:hypothetical protein
MSHILKLATGIFLLAFAVAGVAGLACNRQAGRQLAPALVMSLAVLFACGRNSSWTLQMQRDSFEPKLFLNRSTVICAMRSKRTEPWRCRTSISDTVRKLRSM